MAVEIERKFLVNAALWLGVSIQDGYSIEQGYLLNDGENVVRIRTCDNKGFITIKGKTIGISKPEYEYHIPLQDAKEMMQTLCKTTIKKIRHTLMHNNATWEVDKFSGDNDGLLLAELELTDKDEHVDLPPWVGKEVSGDKRYNNAYLFDHPFKNWK